MNTGSHYRLDVSYNETIADVVDTLKRLGPHLGHNVFFRTSVPGLRNCQELDDLPPVSLRQAEKRTIEKPYYNGFEFQRMNEIATNAFIAAGFSVLDAYTPSVVRNDGRQLYIHNVMGRQNCRRLFAF